MKRWEKIPLSVIVISLLFLVGVVSVDAQSNKGYNEGDWKTQHKLTIREHQLDETFSANGVDTAKMDISNKR